MNKRRKRRTDRMVRVEFSEEELSALINDLIKHQNSKSIAGLIGSVLMQVSDEYSSELIRRIHGFNPVIDYTINQEIYVRLNDISSWYVRKEESTQAGYIVDIPKYGECIKGIITDIYPYRHKPYIVSITYIDDTTLTEKTKEVEVEQNAIRLQNEIDI